MTRPMLMTMTPYAYDRNFGRACNEAMSRLPNGAYACILDHDVMWTTPMWYRQIVDAITQHPDACFAGVTNRIKCPFQLVGADPKSNDMAYHRAFGAQQALDTSLVDVTHDTRTPAGFSMILSTRAWREAGGFPEGLHYLDRVMWESLRMTGHSIYVIRGLYLYHWHRGGGQEPIQAGDWVHDEHVLPTGVTVRLTNPNKPVYDGTTDGQGRPFVKPV